MKRLVIFIAGFAVLASAALANHSWGGYHWARTSNPFTITLVDSATTGWDATLMTASGDWTKSDVLDTVVTPGSTEKRTRQRCAPVAGQVRVCNYTYGNNGWLGVAGIYLSGTHITQGYVKLNDTYYNTTTYNTPEWRALVTCQEIGHTLGLDHQDEGFTAPNLGTCMDYTSDADGGGAYGPANVAPNAHDYGELASIYTHLDSSTTIAGSTGTLPGNAKPFSQASRANGSVYVDHLPGGVTRLTHVFWAPLGG